MTEILYSDFIADLRNSLPIEVLSLTPRAYEGLVEYDIYFIGQLREQPGDFLINYPNVGPVKARRAERYLKRIGLSAKPIHILDRPGDAAMQADLEAGRDEALFQFREKTRLFKNAAWLMKQRMHFRKAFAELVTRHAARGTDDELLQDRAFISDLRGTVKKYWPKTEGPTA